MKKKARLAALCLLPFLLLSACAPQKVPLPPEPSPSSAPTEFPQVAENRYVVGVV